MKIATIIGTRPNFVKCAPLSKEIRKKHEEILIHTGQHYDYEMNKIFFDQLDIPKPDYHLEVGSGNHGFQTAEMLKKIEGVLLKTKPNLVLVFGDCNSTLAGALASSKLKIPLGHIEAGLRSFDKSMPEEVNRVLTDHCSDLLFAPTKNAVKNLENEGLTKNVYNTGDVMVDLLRNHKNIAKKSNILNKLNIEKNQYFLATIHRAGNTDDKNNISKIIESFIEINDEIIFPIHPRTEKKLKKYGLLKDLSKNIRLIKPVGYIEFINLIMNSKKVITDSGGVQKESYILKKPCITLRERTEWCETVSNGWNVLVGTNKKKILKAVYSVNSPSAYIELFGKGNACKKIIKKISNFLD